MATAGSTSAGRGVQHDGALDRELAPAGGNEEVDQPGGGSASTPKVCGVEMSTKKSESTVIRPGSGHDPHDPGIERELQQDIAHVGRRILDQGDQFERVADQEENQCQERPVDDVQRQGAAGAEVDRQVGHQRQADKQGQDAAGVEPVGQGDHVVVVIRLAVARVDFQFHDFVIAAAEPPETAPHPPQSPWRWLPGCSRARTGFADRDGRPICSARKEPSVAAVSDRNPSSPCARPRSQRLRPPAWGNAAECPSAFELWRRLPWPSGRRPPGPGPR